MKLPPFRIDPLDSSRARSQFNSGSEPLDRYFREQVAQDARRRIANCFVAITEVDGDWGLFPGDNRRRDRSSAALGPIRGDEQRIAGYYTLAAASIPLIDLPDKTAKKLPRYPSVPAVLLGRLAVDLAFKGLGLGSALLADAVARAVQAEIASFALMVDAKDKAAASFYVRHGFIPFRDRPSLLFLPLTNFNRTA